jgi:TatD DNase family protein
MLEFAQRAKCVLIDTHAHLSGEAFASDLDDVLARAATAGVGQIVCVGYDLATSNGAIALAERYPHIFATVGMHPNSVAEAPDDWQTQIETLARHPRVVAVGETGLDYYRDWTPPPQQQMAFRWHLDLADQLELPIVIHNRDANEDVRTELERWASTRSSAAPPGVLHSFAGDEAMMHACVAAGFAISFSGMVTFANRSLDALRDVARQVPERALMVETDAPYLAPTPHRGQRNEPAYVRATAERIAAARDTSTEEIERLTTENARRTFHRLGTTAGG